MSFKSRIAILGALSGLLFGGLDAQGSCRASYQASLKKAESVFQKNDGQAAGLVIGGAGWALVMSSAAAEGGAVAVLGPIAVAPGLTTSGVEAVAYYRRVQARKMLRLLDEAEIGNGLLLVELSAELSKGLQKPVPVEEVAAIINDSNRAKVFCPNEDTSYTYADVTTFLAAELSR